MFCSFNCLSMTAYVRIYFDGCNSCQQVKRFGTLGTLPIPAGPWTEIIYDLITGSLLSNGFDSILTEIVEFTKMAHFVTCRETITANKVAEFMPKHVWKLHSTSKTIVSNQGIIFIFQTTKELKKHLICFLHPLKVYHLRTDVQSEISNSVVNWYVHHFTLYWQDFWEALSTTTNFAYNNNDQMFIGLWPFKATWV